MSPIGSRICITESAGAVWSKIDILTKLFCLGSTRIILADINSSRLDLAKSMSFQCPLVTFNLATKDLFQEIMDLTNGEGVARLVDQQEI